MADGFLLTTPDQIRMYWLLAAKGRLGLEIKGLRFKGPALKKRVDVFLAQHYEPCKDKPYPRTKQETLDNLTAYIDGIMAAATEDPA